MTMDKLPVSYLQNRNNNSQGTDRGPVGNEWLRALGTVSGRSSEQELHKYSAATITT